MLFSILGVAIEFVIRESPTFISFSADPGSIVILKVFFIVSENNWIIVSDSMKKSSIINGKAISLFLYNTYFITPS